MPIVFRHRGYRFLFYSNQGNPREPPHFHVVKDGIDAKFWLLPVVALAYNDGQPPKAIRELVVIITSRKSVILETWHGHFRDGEGGALR